MSLSQLKQVSVEDASLKLRCETIRSNSFQSYGLNSVSVQNISQTVSPATTINCNPGAKSYVIITTQPSVLPANSYEGFVLQNALITPTSIVKATIQNYSATYGTNGLPTTFVYNTGAGSVQIGTMNGGNTPLAGFLKIFVEILNSA